MKSVELYQVNIQLYGLNFRLNRQKILNFADLGDLQTAEHH